MSLRRGAIVAVLIALAAWSCQVVDDAAHLVAPGQALRSEPNPPPPGGAPCMEALATGTIAADPSDPSLVWLVHGDAAGRVELGWPWGTTVRFSPEAEVVAVGGTVVAREGERRDLGGGSIDDVFWVCTVDGQVVGDPGA